MTKHNFRINGKFAKKPQDKISIMDQTALNKTSMIENRFCLVVDKSGSMQGLEKDVFKFVNKWIDDIRQLSRIYDQPTKISLITYSDTPRIIYSNLDIEKATEFNNYYVGGMTALFQAQQEAIGLLSKWDNDYKTSKNTSYVVNHITDGYENSSFGGSNSAGVYVYKERINNVIAAMYDRQQLGNWTFSFLVPPGAKKDFSNYGIHSGNIMEWDNTEEGIYQAEQSTSDGLYAYYEARSVGGQSVRNFYGK